MTFHAEVIDALPAAPAPLDWEMLRNHLIKRVAFGMLSSENPQDFLALDALTGEIWYAIDWNDTRFWLDPDDVTSLHDGVSVLVTADNYRYKVASLADIRIRSAKSRTITAPPGSPSFGDAYVLPAAPTGAWATFAEDSIAVYTGRGWLEALPYLGQWLYIEAADNYARFTSTGWSDGEGARVFAADSIPLSALIGFDASGVVKVENQTTYAPPGSRVTGATPTAPLGGVAANFNDFNETTTTTTSALGNLSAVAVAGRIVARLAFASAKDLIAIGLRVASQSSGTTAGHALYYSTDNGSNWTIAGSSFSLSTAATNVTKTGTFAGVTDVALVAAAANFGSTTVTLAGLNGFTTTVTASVGTRYIIASGAIGIFAGNETKVAVCEATDTFTIYTQATGDAVFDKALGIPVQWNGSAWSSAAGAIIRATQPLFQGTGATTAPSGTTGYAYSAATAPTTSQRRTIELMSLVDTAIRAGTRNLSFNYIADVTPASVNVGTGADCGAVVALYRDAGTDAIAWCQLPSSTHIDVVFPVDAPDTSPHTYTIALHSATDSGGFATDYTPTRRFFSVKERA